MPVDFILFAIMLIGISLFHHRSLAIALIGAVAIAAYKIFFSEFDSGVGFDGFVAHLAKEWVILANLLCLLTGFAVLSRAFEQSHLPLALPRYLPAGWKGAFCLLATVWILSSFLDNIAGALIGGAMALHLFHRKVHVGYIVAIVAASNAGGAWSVIGDTTTTMMWIHGVSPARVFEAIIPATVALILVGIPASLQQEKHSPLGAPTGERASIDWARVAIVGFILLVAVVVNLTVNVWFPKYTGHFPLLGAAIWCAILVSVPLRRPDWTTLAASIRGALFLLALVLAASMMPVENLPKATWLTTFGLGFLSAVFDNIPLTALALKQGGYDWGFLAYAVGFGGSMIWFGSSAGVALCNEFPEARSLSQWLRHAWYVPIAYSISFFVMLFVWSWHSDASSKPVEEPNGGLHAIAMNPPTPRTSWRCVSYKTASRRNNSPNDHA